MSLFCGCAQACDEKLRAELVEARVAPLRAQATQKAQVSKQSQETAYRWAQRCWLSGQTYSLHLKRKSDVN